MNNEYLIAQINDHYFGNSASTYDQLIESIISCSKLEQFKALNLDVGSAQVCAIFENATRDEYFGKVFSLSRTRELFAKCKAVVSDTDFI